MGNSNVASSSYTPMHVNLSYAKEFNEQLEEQQDSYSTAANDHPFTTVIEDEHVSGQRVGERKKTIDSESQYMAYALTNFGSLYATKENEKLEGYVQLSLQIVEMNVSAKERAVQTCIEAEEHTH